jgi:hypothetical protein
MYVDKKKVIQSNVTTWGVLFLCTMRWRRIWNISVNSTACADVIALISEEQDQAQILINMAYDYA